MSALMYPVAVGASLPAAPQALTVPSSSTAQMFGTYTENNLPREMYYLERPDIPFPASSGPLRINGIIQYSQRGDQSNPKELQHYPINPIGYIRPDIKGWELAILMAQGFNMDAIVDHSLANGVSDNALKKQYEMREYRYRQTRGILKPLGKRTTPTEVEDHVPCTHAQFIYNTWFVVDLTTATMYQPQRGNTPPQTRYPLPQPRNPTARMASIWRKKQPGVPVPSVTATQQPATQQTITLPSNPGNILPGPSAIQPANQLPDAPSVTGQPALALSTTAQVPASAQATVTTHQALRNNQSQDQGIQTGVTPAAQPRGKRARDYDDEDDHAQVEKKRIRKAPTANNALTQNHLQDQDGTPYLLRIGSNHADDKVEERMHSPNPGSLASRSSDWFQYYYEVEPASHKTAEYTNVFPPGSTNSYGLWEESVPPLLTPYPNPNRAVPASEAIDESNVQEEEIHRQGQETATDLAAVQADSRLDLEVGTWRGDNDGRDLTERCWCGRH